MKRHRPEEMIAKLGQASLWAKKGLSQAEICSKLGISVMTFHRWRKMQGRQLDAHQPRLALEGINRENAPSSHSVDDLQRLHELQLENLQLRKIITDLLLEKLRVEERYAADLDGEPIKLAVDSPKHVIPASR